MDPAPLILRVRAVADQVAIARRAMSEYARLHGADPDAVALAVSEAVTNAVLHAYVDRPAPGHVEVLARTVPSGGITVTVADDGDGIKPRSDSPGLGLGLPLLATLTDDLDVRRRPAGGTLIYMTFAAARPVRHVSLRR